jgi:hypothetical protein
MALMEEQGSVAQEDTTRKFNLSNIITNNTYAVDYSDRFPKVYWRKLWILTQVDTNTPIQQLSQFQSSPFDVVIESNIFVAYVWNDEVITGTGTQLVSSAVGYLAGKSYSSCKNIYNGNTITQWIDGMYTITRLGDELRVYCNMSDSWGGWTSFYATDVSNINTITGTNIAWNSSAWSMGGNYGSVDLTWFEFEAFLIQSDIWFSQDYNLLWWKQSFINSLTNVYPADNISNDEWDCAFMIRYRTSYSNPVWEVGINSENNAAMDSGCRVWVWSTASWNNTMAGVWIWPWRVVFFVR